MRVFMIIGGLSGMELAIILLIVLMIFGAGKLPMVFRQLGSGIRDFQEGLRGDEETPPKEIEDTTASNTSAPTSSNTKSEATS